MHRIVEKQYFNELRDLLHENLPPIFLYPGIKEQVEELQKKYMLSPEIALRLTKSASKLKTQWNKKALFALYRNKNMRASPTPLDILQALTNHSPNYLSHYSALYFNNLIEQRPSRFFITSEIAGKSGAHSSDLSELRIKQAFLKPARSTSKFFSYKENDYYILEKPNINKPGVIRTTLDSQGNPITLQLTSPERTLIDSIIAPHYSGGIATVINAFSKAKLNMPKLISIYEQLNLYYPYWQTIGLILEQTGKTNDVQVWQEKFSQHNKINFYIDRNARLNWEFSGKWKVYFPKGLF